MDRKEIEKTPWARRFKRSAPVSYRKAIDYASNPETEYFLEHTNETGEMLWHIVVDDTDFWMDSFKRKEHADALCKQMGWKVIT